MKKNNRDERLELIIKYLTVAQNGISITDVHKRLVEEHHLNVSRKTIERDITEIVRKGFFILDSKSPMTVYRGEIRECIMHLTNEDITYLLVVLPEKNPIRERLLKFMGLDSYCLGDEIEQSIK